MGGAEWGDLWRGGVLMVILGAFAWGVWQTIAWAKTKIAEPVISSHLDLLAKLKETLPKQEKLLEQLANILKYQSVDLAQHRVELTEKFESLLEANVQQTALLRQIEQHQQNGHSLEHKATYKPTDHDIKTVEKLAEEEKRRRNKRGEP